MLKSVQGIYRHGKIELSVQPEGINDDTPVVVTFLESEVDLRERGIDEETAADLRTRLAPFAEDWNSPEMSIYDDYEARSADA